MEFSSTADSEYVIHAGEFKQIVTNLLANAIDAVGREGESLYGSTGRIWRSTAK